MRSLLSATVAAAVGGVLLAAPATSVLAEEVVVKMWSRADRSGPLRSGNIVAAANILNESFEAAGSETRVRIDLFENNANGFDQDALDLLQAFAIDKGPDIYVAAHEWVGEFARNGYAMDMTQFVEKNDWAFGDVIPVLWESVRYKGKIHAIPQDSEIRMIFYNKDMLRKAGKSEEFIESLPGKVEEGLITAADWGQIVKEVVDSGAAEMGQIHRPNVGPDYLMTFAGFGATFQNPETGKLMLAKGPMLDALTWFDWMARNNATPSNNTAMSWDDVQNSFKQERVFAYHHGIWTMSWQLGDERGNTWPTDEKGYFEKIGWIPQPPAEKGGKPANLSHPIVYVVNPQSENAELAARLVALATLPHFNTQHAVGSYHTAILNGQRTMPAYAEVWPLAKATELLSNASFMPSHPDFGKYNGLLYKALQGVETGRLDPEEAVLFLEDELSVELGDELEIVE
ncbi:extracellular solute-binding protein [Geminicoccaceae bacterium 1502E]|nr:extracellular solute-binding protein [Geminicoccaceae bacterium 1502E]